MKFLNGFRQFFEDMDPNPDKVRDLAVGSPKKPHEEREDYFSTLQDEQGLTWQQIVDIFEGEPWVSAAFGTKRGKGQLLHKTSPWEIVKGTMTPNGADIRLKPSRQDKSYLKSDSGMTRAKFADTKRYHLTREELIKFLTQGWMPAVQQTMQ